MYLANPKGGREAVHLLPGLPVGQLPVGQRGQLAHHVADTRGGKRTGAAAHTFQIHDHAALHDAVAIRRVHDGVERRAQVASTESRRDSAVYVADEDRAAITHMATRLQNQFLHHPRAAVRSAVTQTQAPNNHPHPILDSVRHLFGLGDRSASALKKI